MLPVPLPPPPPPPAALLLLHLLGAPPAHQCARTGPAAARQRRSSRLQAGWDVADVVTRSLNKKENGAHGKATQSTVCA